jgi:hypothetical protein
MEYKFSYKITAIDLWKLAMYGIYGSIVGVANIIFTISMFALVVRFWRDVNTFLKILLILGVFLFIIIQPMMIYLKSKKQIEAVPVDMEIGFDDKGMHIKTSNQDSIIKWKEIKSVIKKSSMIIILLNSNQGFIITNNMIGEEKDDFFNYLVSKTNK